MYSTGRDKIIIKFLRSLLFNLKKFISIIYSSTITGGRERMGGLKLVNGCGLPSGYAVNKLD